MRQVFAVLLLLGLPRAQSIRIEEVQVRPAESSYRCQWIELENRSLAAIDVGALSLRAGARLKRLVPFALVGTNFNGLGAAAFRERTIRPGGRALVLDRGWAGEENLDLPEGLPVLSISDASLGQGVFLKCGETIGLEGPEGAVDEMRIGSVDREQSWVRTSFGATASLEGPHPGRKGREEERFEGVSGGARLVLWTEEQGEVAGPGGLLVAGSPTFAEWRVVDERRRIDAGAGGEVRLQPHADLHLVPSDTNLPALRSGQAARWPLRNGRSCRFAIATRSFGPLALEAGRDAEEKRSFRLFSRAAASPLRITEVRARGLLAEKRLALRCRGSVGGPLRLTVWDEGCESWRRWTLPALGPGDHALHEGRLLDLYSTGYASIREEGGRTLEAVAWFSPGSALPESEVFTRAEPERPALDASAWLSSAERASPAAIEWKVVERLPAGASLVVEVRLPLRQSAVLEAHDREGRLIARTGTFSGTFRWIAPSEVSAREGLVYLVAHLRDGEGRPLPDAVRLLRIRNERP